jgi:trehalose synthase
VYGTLALTTRTLRDYVPFVGETKIDELRELAKPLKGLRLLNLSVTAFGTGVAELLRCSVPLLCDLGLDCRWQVVRADDGASQVSKAMYHALAGGEVHWTGEMTNTWRRYTTMNADLFTEEYDVVVVHDLQPAAIRSYVEPRRHPKARWLLHCHIDLGSAQPDVWRLLERHIRQYDAWIFEDERFTGDLRDTLPLSYIAPAVDPLGPRNMEISTAAIGDILARYGIDVARPLICQVAPLNKDSDALGALEVYRLLRKRMPDLQMAMVATSLPDDPAAYAYFERVVREVGELPDVHILSNLDDAGDVEVNVVQRASRAMMQRALHKGFGIWLSDALWKETPVVAAPMGGASRQVIHGRTGYLASSNEEFAGHLASVIENTAEARRLGVAGRRHVADNYLVCRYVADYLRVMREIMN